MGDSLGPSTTTHAREQPAAQGFGIMTNTGLPGVSFLASYLVRCSCGCSERSVLLHPTLPHPAQQAHHKEHSSSRALVCLHTRKNAKANRVSWRRRYVTPTRNKNTTKNATPADNSARTQRSKANRARESFVSFATRGTHTRRASNVRSAINHPRLSFLT